VPHAAGTDRVGDGVRRTRTGRWSRTGKLLPARRDRPSARPSHAVDLTTLGAHHVPDPSTVSPSRRRLAAARTAPGGETGHERHLPSLNDVRRCAAVSGGVRRVREVCGAGCGAAVPHTLLVRPTGRVPAAQRAQFRFGARAASRERTSALPGDFCVAGAGEQEGRCPVSRGPRPRRSGSATGFRCRGHGSPGGGRIHVAARAGCGIPSSASSGPGGLPGRRGRASCRR
jgi:hypothetical protein